jgi:NAD+ diphosphatase
LRYLQLLSTTDAQWFTRETIMSVLNHPQGTNFVGRALQDGNGPVGGPEGQDPPFRVPPLLAIAGVLIRDWAEGKFKPNPQYVDFKKGNL